MRGVRIPLVACVCLYVWMGVCTVVSARVLHEPQLNTILMVEKAIKNAEDYPTKTELWKSLPKKMQYQTFKRILDYLEASNKIIFNEKKIVWVAVDNPKLKRLLATSIKVR